MEQTPPASHRDLPPPKSWTDDSEDLSVPVTGGWYGKIVLFARLGRPEEMVLVCWEFTTIYSKHVLKTLHVLNNAPQTP